MSKPEISALPIDGSYYVFRVKDNVLSYLKSDSTTDGGSDVYTPYPIKLGGKDVIASSSRISATSYKLGSKFEVS